MLPFDVIIAYSFLVVPASAMLFPLISAVTGSPFLAPVCWLCCVCVCVFCGVGRGCVSVCFCHKLSVRRAFYYSLVFVFVAANRLQVLSFAPCIVCLPPSSVLCLFRVLLCGCRVHLLSLCCV